MNTLSIARLRSFVGLFLLSALFILVPTATAWPQGGAASSDDILPASGTAAFLNEYKNTPSAGPLLSGKEAFDPKNPKQIAIIDMEAKNTIYRLTWPNYQRGYEDTKDAKNNVVRDFTHSIDSQFQLFSKNLGSLANPKNPTAKAVAPVYSKQVIEHAMEVVTQTRKPIGQINAARALCRLAEVPDKDPTETPDRVLVRLGVAEEGKPAVINDLAGAFLKCLKNPNDAVKVYAVKGLYDLLKLPNAPKEAELTDKTRQEIATDLGQFIMHPWQFAVGYTPQEFEGARSLRREAIRTLAQLRTPIIGDQKPALVLLKVMAGEGVSPEARTDERIEAAIGLAGMKPDPEKGYQQDYAMYQLSLYIGDLAQRIVTDKEKPARAWKIYAARLTDGLVTMYAASNNEYVKKTAEKCRTEVLQRLELDGAKAQILYDKFHDELIKTPPPAKSLFKGDDKSVVTMPK